MSEGANDVAPPLLITQLSETAGLVFAGNYQINRGKMAEGMTLISNLLLWMPLSFARNF